MKQITIDNKPSFGYNFISYFASRMPRLKAYQSTKKLDAAIKNAVKRGTKQNFSEHKKFGDSVVTTIADLKTYILNPNGKNTIVYLHGGAFINRPTKYHVNFALKIAKQTDSKLYMPYYPLAPNSNVQDCLGALLHFANSIEDNFVLLGDSAGGGLIFSLQYFLVEHNLGNRVLALVAVSPWLDMRVELAEKQTDRMLNRAVVKQISMLWKGDLSLSHPYCSPAAINYDNLNALIIVGGKEALINDSNQLLSNNKNCNITLVNYLFLEHDFAIYPVPESKSAIKTIVEYINSVFKENN